MAADSPVRALLQFDHELSPTEVNIAEMTGLHFVRHGASIVHVGCIYEALVDGISSLMDLSAIGLERASSGSKQFYPSLTSSVPAIHAPEVWYNLKKDNNAINGSGVLVATIDTGATWTHPSFWRPSTGPINVIEDGGSFYADLDNDSIADSDEGPIDCIEGIDVSSTSMATDYLYLDLNGNGRFDLSAGEHWLGGIDANHDGIISLPSEQVVVLGESKIAYLYDQNTGNVYVRGVNLTDAALVTDPQGHGTHVASTIAGGQPGFTSMLGVAPGADLMIIKSPLDSASILDAIHFAVMHGADVINMSFSSYLGFLDGTDLEDLAVSEAFRTAGVLSTLAAGNLGGRSKHAMFIVPGGGEESTTLSVHSPPKYSFLNILWHSDNDDEHVVLTSPNDDAIDLGSFESRKNKAWSVDTNDLKAYVFFDESMRGTNRIIIQISASNHEWVSGNWRVTVTNPEGGSVKVHAYSWDGTWSGASMRFLSQVTSLGTISSPGTADLGITVSSYDEGTHSVSPSSSLGPRIDDVAKPQVIAPGVSIKAARNSLSSLWTIKSGTSMAAPHVAGVLALIRQASGSHTGWLDYTALIDGAGGMDGHYQQVHYEFGFGLVDASWSVQHVLNQSIGTGINLSDWTGIPKSVADSEDTQIKGSQDILSVYSYLQQDKVSLGVALRSQPNLTDGMVMSVRWDTDGSKSTGSNGIDLVVNITQSGTQAYEWTGSQFQPSSLSVTSWMGNLALFVSIERTSSQFGALTVSTHNSSLSPIDITNEFTLHPQWRPLVTDLNLAIVDQNLTARVTMYDRDNPVGDYNISWSFVDGAFTAVASNTVLGQRSVTLDIPNYIAQEGLPIGELGSLMFSISSSQDGYILPPLSLTMGTGLDIGITEAYLDNDHVRVGPFISESITGVIHVSGYDYVDDVQFGLRASSGLWLNFTLDGSSGLYTIDVAASSLNPDTYTVYAIVHTQLDTTIEEQFATLVITEDYSILIFGVAGTLGLIVIAKLIITLRTRRTSG